MEAQINNCYLYIFLDQRKYGLYKYDDLEFLFEPFYIGIARTKNRCSEHLYESYSTNSKTHKCNRIRKIKKETGNDPVIIKLFENLSYEESKNLEIMYIKKNWKI